MSKILKHEIPVDGEWHDLPVNGAVTHVGPHPFSNEIVLLWAVHDDDAGGTRRFRVFATGEDLPPNTRIPQNLVGTVVTTDRTHVWHVISTWYPGDE